MTTSTQLQLRRGTSGQVLAMTPAAGEPIVDTTNWRGCVGDGSTAGGRPMTMARDAQNNAFIYAATGGTGNAYTLTLSPVPAAYQNGQPFFFKIDRNNTASATLNVNSLGAITFKKKSGGALVTLDADDLVANTMGMAAYNSTGPCIELLNLLDAGGGFVSVSQGNINSSTGSVSVSGTAIASVTLPGGLYGFMPQIKLSTGSATTGSTANFVNPAAILGTSYATTISMGAYNGGVSVLAQQLYINASPPFVLGDGPMANFVFLKMNKAEDILATYVADVPPWAYNGPTSLEAHHICPFTGKKSQWVKRKRSWREIIEGAPVEYDLREITQAVKNADMPLIPHPFGNLGPGEIVVLLNPHDERLARIMEHHGDSGVVDALHAGKIYTDTEFLTNIKGPPGVAIAPLRLKYSD